MKNLKTTADRGSLMASRPQDPKPQGSRPCEVRGQRPHGTSPCEEFSRPNASKPEIPRLGTQGPGLSPPKVRPALVSLGLLVMGFFCHEVLILNWSLGTVWPWDKKVNGNTMATSGDPTLSYPNVALQPKPYPTSQYPTHPAL